MVELELEGGFTLHVPLKPRMTAHEFLEMADRLEHLSEKGGHEHHYLDVFVKPTPSSIPPPQAPAQITPQQAVPIQTMPLPPPSADDFKLPNEDLVRVQHLSNQVKSHMDHIRRHEEVIVRHERHLSEILDYLQSLDKYIRK